MDFKAFMLHIHSWLAFHHNILVSSWTCSYLEHHVLWRAAFVAETRPSFCAFKQKKGCGFNTRHQRRCLTNLWSWNYLKKHCKCAICKSQLSPNKLLLCREGDVLSCEQLFGVWGSATLSSTLSGDADTLKSVILICWLLPAEGRHLPGKRAVISLSSPARCYFCQNFNRLTKSIPQGRINKKKREGENTVLINGWSCSGASVAVN